MNNLNSQLPHCLINRGYILKNSSGKWWVENSNHYIINDKLYDNSTKAIDNAIINFKFAKYSKKKPKWYYIH